MSMGCFMTTKRRGRWGRALRRGLAGVRADEPSEVDRINTRWFEMSNDMLAEANLSGYFVRVNGEWERTLGWTPDEMLSRPMLDFVHPDDVHATAAVAGALDDRPDEVVNYENRYRAKDGSWRWLLWNARSDGQRKYAVARDITDRKALEQERQGLFERVQEMSRTDSLTGLPNRRSWDDEVTRALARSRRSGQPLTLAMVDLDHFKRFNDSHGHQAGDALLAEVSATWRRELRSTDFLARYGGEEFALLLPDCTPDEAAQVFEHLRAATPHDQTCSVGIAHWDRCETAEDLLSRADAALYEAKRVGRDRVVISV
jgi:diguanylate cyclase (GGDEF)-like protein/PAS domain S-box-containing protein